MIKLLAILSAVGLTATQTAFSFSLIQNSNSFKNKFSQLKSYDPTYQDQELNNSTYAAPNGVWSGWSKGDSSKDEDSNIISTGFTKQELINNYTSINIKSILKYNGGKTKWDIPDDALSTMKTKTYNTNFAFSEFGTWKELGKIELRNSWATIDPQLKVDWIGEQIKTTVSVEVYAWGVGVNYSYSMGNFSSTKIVLNSKNGYSQFQSKFDATMKNSIIINTSTSRYLDSDLTQSITAFGGIEDSNKTKIKNEVLKRIEAAFKSTDTSDIYYKDVWKKKIDFDNPIITYPKPSKDIKQDNITITFKDKNLDSFNSKFTHTFKIPILLKFNEEELKKKIETVFANSFKLVSDTSSDISSTLQDSFNGTVISNKQRIENEIDLRIKKVFPIGMENDYIKYNLIFNTNNNTVEIRFKGSTDDNIIESGQLLDSVSMKINLSLSEAYYSQSTIKRMEVEPSKIVDNSSSENSLKDDVPEFKLDTHTFIFHNSVTLRFAASTDGSEMLLVNGTEVPVWNHIYKIQLKDLREFSIQSNSEPTSYRITVYKLNEKGDKITTLEANILIDGITTSIDGQWVGWNPQEKLSKPEYYEQWLMTQPFILVDGERKPNPKYRPDIDSKTGTVRTKVFVKDESKVHNFASDPLDNQGLLINEANGNLDKRQKGYIAEASVATSGIEHKELDNALKSGTISKIERVKLDPNTMKEISKREILSVSEAELSSEGLYHYIIYQKNNVIHEGGVSINGTYTEDINASEGSTIHKLFFIRNDKADTFKNFLDIKEIQDNGLVSSFNDSVQFRHLKDFLLEQGVTAQQLSNLNYEQTISVWYQYVSKTVRNQNAAPSINYYDLKELGQLENLKVNKTTSSELLASLRQHTKQILSKIGENSVSLEEGSDFIITNSISSNVMIDENELKKLLVNAQKQHTEATIYIKSSITSLTIQGKNSFELINDFNFPPDNNEWLDLKNIKFNDFENNFSNQSVNELKKWIKEDVSRKVNKAASNGQKYNYLDDYIITLNNSTEDFMNEYDTLDKFIKNNLSSLIINIRSNNNSPKIKGNNKFNLINNISYPIPPKRKTEIQNLFTKRDLGILEDIDGNGVIDKTEIWNKLIEINKIDMNVYDDLKMDLFIFKVTKLSSKEYKVAMTAKNNDYYEGTVELKYTSSVSPDESLKKGNIAELFTNPNLENIKDNNGNGVIDKTEIWNKLIEINKIDMNVYDDLKMDLFNFNIKEGQSNYYTLKITLKTECNYYGEANTKFYSEYPIGFDDNTKEKNEIKIQDLTWIIPLIFFIISLGIGWYFLNKHRKKNINKGKVIETNEKVVYTPDLFKELEIGRLSGNKKGIVDNLEIWNKLIEINKLEQKNININDFKMKYHKKLFSVSLEPINTSKYNGNVEISFSNVFGTKIKIKRKACIKNIQVKDK